MPERFFTPTETIKIEGRETTLLDELEAQRSSTGFCETKWVMRVQRSDGLQIPFNIFVKDWGRLRAWEAALVFFRHYPDHSLKAQTPLLHLRPSGAR